ncbi:MAG: U32 family peptidase [Candidatus Eremiobacteraeota bacterium]|nr:U32 family peptidase [Candidatus Eremiobacteraeota bacterium]
MAGKKRKFFSKKPELVAPAGNLEHLKVAIEERADSIYVGPVGLSGRPRIAEMTMSQIRDARKITRENKIRLFVAVNASLPWGKKKIYLDALKQLCDMEVDALIIGDPAVLNLVKSLPNPPALHASTFLGIYNPPAAIWAKSLGFQRLVLNTGIYPDEIRSITKKSPGMEYELIAYGPICFNDNYRCNLPHGARSRSRMKDVRSFSKEFTYCQSKVEVREGKKILKKGRLLCWPIIDLSENLLFYISIGIRAFKIAGRERETEYIRLAVRKMRQAIDSLPDTIPPGDHYAYCLHISERRPG